MEKKNRILAVGIFGIFFAVIILSVISATHLPKQCNDGIDNDLDGKVDFPNDNGCDSGTDNTESLKLGYADGCLTNGDKLEDIFGNLNYECSSTLCKVCILMTEVGNWTTLPSKCSGLPQCGFNNGGGAGEPLLDVEPPVLTINNPVQNHVYDSRKVLLDLETNEKADIYYTELNNSNARWTRVCTDCTSYSRERRFDEGLNNLSFRVTDSDGNEDYFNVSFIVDSKDPRIRGTSPTKGFVNTVFEIEFEEDNPVSLELHYGNNITGMAVEPLDLELDCQKDKRTTCQKDVNLTAYDGQDIEYFFIIEDIAGNVDESRHYILSVDDTDPKINNLGSFYTIDGRYVYFNISVTELNLDEVGYSYIDDRGRLKEKRLCSRLDKEDRDDITGICEKRVSFRDGTYDLTVYVIDEAGNNIGVPISFFTDSKDPRIKKTLPKRGFADGNFYVEFQEENPSELTLYYGIDSDTRTSEVDIGSECESIKGRSDKQSCDVSVDLADYNGKEMEYWFEITDTIGNKDISRIYSLDVDTSYPVINNPDSFYNYTNGSRYVYFNISVTELNLDEVDYSYIDDRGRLKEKRLCSRLDKEDRDDITGICEKRVSFRDGTYDLTVYVIDEAGNSVAVPASFEIVR